MVGLAAIAPILTVASTALSIGGQLMAGSAAKKEGDFEAAQYRQQAMEVNAAASRTAADKIRMGKLVQERAQAVSAASGGSTTDPTTVNIESNIAGQSEYDAMTAVWSGAAEAAGLQTTANAAEAEGKNKRNASYIGAISTGLAGVGSMFAKYGAGEPGSPSTYAAVASGPPSSAYG